MHITEIVYDCDAHVFAMYLDAELVGYARTYHEAMLTLNELLCEMEEAYYFCEAA